MTDITPTEIGRWMDEGDLKAMASLETEEEGYGRRK